MKSFSTNGSVNPAKPKFHLFNRTLNQSEQRLLSITFLFMSNETEGEKQFLLAHCKVSIFLTAVHPSIIVIGICFQVVNCTKKET